MCLIICTKLPSSNISKKQNKKIVFRSNFIYWKLLPSNPIPSITLSHIRPFTFIVYYHPIYRIKIPIHMHIIISKSQTHTHTIYYVVIVLKIITCLHLLTYCISLFVCVRSHCVLFKVYYIQSFSYTLPSIRIERI